MSKTIDQKVVDDIVGLIEADRANQGRTEALAHLILGRLGYEVEQPSSFPDISPGEWARIISTNSVEVFSDNIKIIHRTLRPTPRELADAQLIAAAPRLMEAGYEYVTGGADAWKHMKAALRDAGVDIELG